MTTTLLPAIRSIAREAGHVILRYYLDGADIAIKADGSPVTAADHAAEAIILPALHRLTPDIPAISEEQQAAGLSPAAAGTFWLVDPLDGTRSFIDHTDEFTVNIGLIQDGEPVLGVIFVPATGALYAADGPGRALESLPGHPDQPIAARTVPARGLTVLCSRRHGDQAALLAYLDGRGIADQRPSSSSLKFCLLARGDADIYPRFGPTGEWDTAAGHAILKAAGGCIETPDGQPLAYGKPGYLNGAFIAHGRR